jgi:hypothetical protein
MYALPHTYHHVEAEEGTTIKLTVSSEIGGDWYLKKKIRNWELSTKQPVDNIVTEVIITPQTAWKLFTKAMSTEHAIANSVIKGNAELGNIVFNSIAVMA